MASLLWMDLSAAIESKKAAMFIIIILMVIIQGTVLHPWLLII
jgi:hypothetical protein